MNRPEQALQRAVASYLKDRKLYVRDLVYTHIPHGGKRSKTEAAIFKGLGVVAGAPDFIIWMKFPRVLQVELKPAKGRLSTVQKEFGEALETLGHSYHVITAATPADAVTQLVALLDA